MDRTAFKAIASQIKSAGHPIKVLKTDTDDVLKAKINEALQQIPSAAVTAQLEAFVPEKLTMLKRDCFGLFIDLADVSCLRCADVQRCAAEYLVNIQGDKLAVLAPAVKGAAPVGKASPLPSPTPVAKKPAKVTYEPDQIVFVKNMKNPNQKGTEEYDVVQAILDEVPGTMSELREIIARGGDQTDKQFIQFLTALRNVGVIKLVMDLSDENKAELRKAGFEI